MDAELMSWKLGWKLKEKIDDGQVKFDIGGHFHSISSNHEFIKNNWRSRLKATSIQLKALNKAIETETPLAEFIQFEQSHFLECGECGELVSLETNGTEIRCVNPCPHPQGLPAYEIELNVPSGKFVVANDLRPYFPIVGDYNVNKTICCKQTSDKYAQAGMAHMNVGNTCPGMFRINDGSFVIGTVGKQNPVKGSRRVASICTDLWWYSIVDYDQFLIRAKRKPDNDEQIVVCKPGVYRFKHQYHLVRDNCYTRADVYSFIDWVRKPDPVRDFQGEWMSLNFTAGQILQDKLKGRYGDLYTQNRVTNEPLSLMKSLMVAADHLMCINGSGEDHHPNGWVGSNPDLTMDAPDLKIPMFRGKHRWYPMSDWSFLAKTAGIGRDYNDKGPIFLYMNPSFVELAFNICQNIIKHGNEPVYTDVDKKHDHCKSNVAIAKKCFEALVKRFPKQIPSYCKSLIK